MMLTTTDSSAPPTIAQLEARQDEVLRQLDDLSRRVERVLAQWSTVREPSPSRPGESSPRFTIRHGTSAAAIAER